MNRSANILFFNYLYEMSLLETMEFAFCEDIIIDYRDDMIGIHDRTYDYYIAWHGVIGK